MRGAAMKIGQVMSMEGADILPPEFTEALAILRQFSGTGLNPMLVRAFTADIKENGLALNPARSISLYRPVFDRRLMESALNGLAE